MMSSCNKIPYNFCHKNQRHSKEMSPRDHVKCKWTFQPHHGSKVCVSSDSYHGSTVNFFLQVLVRYLTADFPETEHCAGSYLRLGDNYVFYFHPSSRIYNEASSSHTSGLNYPGYNTSCGLNFFPKEISRFEEQFPS